MCISKEKEEPSHQDLFSLIYGHFKFSYARLLNSYLPVQASYEPELVYFEVVISLTLYGITTLVFYLAFYKNHLPK